MCYADRPNSFCRKTTMVKHQRRSHHRGAHPQDIDDGETSDSDGGESPTTPRQCGPAQWPHVTASSSLHAHTMHRAQSFNDIRQHQSNYDAPFLQRHSISGVRSYSSTPVMHNQHTVQVVSHAPQQYHQPQYIPEFNNPGVATLNVHAPIPLHYQMQRQATERNDAQQYMSHAPHMNTLPESIQSSPDSYSSASSRGSISQDVYYTHQPVQSMTYPIHTSPVEQQPMVSYQQQLPQPMPQSISQNPAVQAPQLQQTSQQYQPNPQSEEQWYQGVAYQPPIEVVSSAPAFNNGLYDPWSTKIEAYEDTSLQMPSARIASL